MAVALFSHHELFVMLESFKYVADVIHWFQTAAKAKLHNFVA
ncbi:MAG TPA: hypothetical protein VFD48_08435 [Pyrinomonadaceae bacterium]|nr:hypothetical protein [Pyrinomonadaceae bacterium]